MSRRYTADRRRIATMRLAAQRIVGAPAPSPGTPIADALVDTARHLLATQAQDLPGARWSLGLRTPGATDLDVAAALDAGLLVRSWPQRGTLHITAPEDLDGMLRLTANRTMRQYGAMHRRLGLDDDEFARARAIAERAVADGPVARPRLLQLLADGGVASDAQRSGHLIVHLAVARVIVHGPADGKQPTFVAYASRVPASAIDDSEELVARLVLRYLTSHGPATDRDLAWWSSLTLTDIRRGIAAHEAALERLDIGGTTYWHAPGLEPAARSVVALPGFDELLLGYQDRSASLHLDHAETIVPGGNGMFLPTIVVDGEVAGTWKRSSSAKALTIQPIPFGPLAQRDRTAFARAARQYGRFVGKDAVLIDAEAPA